MAQASRSLLHISLDIVNLLEGDGLTVLDGLVITSFPTEAQVTTSGDFAYIDNDGKRQLVNVEIVVSA